jgi:hypothetical protein
MGRVWYNKMKDRNYIIFFAIFGLMLLSYVLGSQETTNVFLIDDTMYIPYMSNEGELCIYPNPIPNETIPNKKPYMAINF